MPCEYYIKKGGMSQFLCRLKATVPLRPILMALTGHIIAVTCWPGDNMIAQWWPIAPGTPPILPAGVAFTLRIYWRNDSDVSVRGNMLLKVVRPDGSGLFPGVVSGQNAVKGPGVISMFEFAPFILEGPGTWKGEMQLSGEGV